MFDKELAQLREAHKTSPVPSYKERLNQLNRLELALINNKDSLSEALNKDFGGRAHKETSLYEIIPSLEEIRHARHHLKNWMQIDRRRPSLWLQGGRSYVQAFPKGIVGIMVPWNYPIFLSFGPLVAAFAAGNKVMLKLSEDAANTSALLQKILNGLFSNNELIVICGDVKVSQEFSKLALDHLLFTGSTAVGYHILNDAAKTMKSVTLELGGKSPVIIGQSANLQQACQRIITGKLINAGQTCVAPDYVLMQQNQLEDFISYAKEHVAQSYPNILNNPNYTSIINQRQFKRLQEMLDDAKLKGATVIALSDSSIKTPLNNKRCLPHIILNATKDMLVMQQEIFGPILPIIITDNIKQMIEFINQDEKPLALYYFGFDKNEQQQILENTNSGGVTINGVITHVADPSLPFGGIGKSGMGQYHAKEGFDTFSHKRAIFKQSRLSSLDYISAPYPKLSAISEYMLFYIDLKSWTTKLSKGAIIVLSSLTIYEILKLIFIL